MGVYLDLKSIVLFFAGFLFENEVGAMVPPNINKVKFHSKTKFYL